MIIITSFNMRGVAMAIPITVATPSFFQKMTHVPTHAHNKYTSFIPEDFVVSLNYSSMSKFAGYRHWWQW